jgi:N-acetylneuraminic acid mutarotase
MPDGPTARRLHEAVWTGSEMFVLGGYRDAEALGSGASFDPATGSWRSLPTQGGPRGNISPVWTGKELLVWTNNASHTSHDIVIRYQPALNKWTLVTAPGAPSPRWLSAVVWTGQEAIVWGGLAKKDLNTGGRFDPAKNSWTQMANIGAPAPRRDPTAIWTGSEMLVWGGADEHRYMDSGGRYDPVKNTWRPISRKCASQP